MNLSSNASGSIDQFFAILWVSAMLGLLACVATKRRGSQEPSPANQRTQISTATSTLRITQTETETSQENLSQTIADPGSQTLYGPNLDLSADIDRGKVKIVFVDREQSLFLSSEKPLDYLGNVEIEQKQNRIKARHNPPTNNDNTSFLLEVPRAKSLVINLTNGSISFDVSSMGIEAKIFELILGGGQIQILPSHAGLLKFFKAYGQVDGTISFLPSEGLTVKKNAPIRSFTYASPTLKSGPQLNFRVRIGEIML